MSPPANAHPLCVSAWEYFMAGDYTAEGFVYICNMTNSATLEWALSVVATMGGT